jgi:putative membrane protein
VGAWARVERALRLRQALPAPRALMALAGGVVVLGAFTLVLALVEIARK